MIKETDDIPLDFEARRTQERRRAKGVNGKIDPGNSSVAVLLVRILHNEKPTYVGFSLCIILLGGQ